MSAATGHAASGGGDSAFRPSAVEWFCLAAGLALTLRYRWIMDDAFVYFRYIDNFLFLHLGLVYNQGEYVEGFSSPAWLLLLLPLRALHADYWLATQALGCLGFGLFWFLLVRLNRELSPPGVIVNLPLVYLASNYAVLCYFTSGLETLLVQMLAVAYALYVLDPSSRARELAVAVSPLVRPELAAPVGICVLWRLWRDRRIPYRLVALAAGITGAWMVFRVYYYADLFPNTFYLKSAFDPGQGLVYLNETLSTYHFYGTAAAVLAAALYLARRRNSSPELRLGARLLMLLLALSVTAYVVSIGGDPRHYRYLAFPFCLAACSFGGLAERLMQALDVRRNRVAIPLGLALFAVFFLAYPPQLRSHPVTLKEKQRRLNKISDASYHRHMKRLQYAKWSRAASISRMQAYRQRYPRFRYRTVSQGFWCVDLYERFDERVVHSLGLTDAILARTEMEAERPAHKWGLVRLARDLVRLYRSTPAVGRGMFRDLAKRGLAPEWVVDNLDRIEVIERKIFNRHDLTENLQLAFTFPGKILPSSSRIVPRAALRHSPPPGL